VSIKYLLNYTCFICQLYCTFSVYFPGEGFIRLAENSQGW